MSILTELGRAAARFRVVVTAGLLAVTAVAVQGQEARFDLTGDVGLDQRLNEQVPLDLVFVDETGAEVSLGNVIDGKPAVLALVYHQCPMLCNLSQDGLVRSLRALSLSAGKDFTVITVSFDPREGPELAAAKKKVYLEHYGRAGAERGWHFLTGSEQSIRRLTESVGFRYAWDQQTGQYAHAAGIVVLTPEGKISRYFYGVEYPPRDLRLGLVEASANKIGSATDRVLLFCYQYDPTTGKYGLVIMRAIRLGGLATVLGLISYIGIMIRRERRRPKQEPS
jgi:protein SCO1/2